MQARAVSTIVMVLLAAGAAACGGKGGSSSGGTTPGGGGGEAAVAVPGACVDPMDDARTRMARIYEEEAGKNPTLDADPFASDEPSERPGPDLDGDGTADLQILSPEWLDAGVSATLVYVMRGACGHYVGDLGRPTQEVAPGKSHGLVDLFVVENSSCEGAPCGCEPGFQLFRFDGTEYRFDEGASTLSREKPCD